MNEYITKEQALHAVNDSFIDAMKPNEFWALLKEYMNAIPAADVAPVVHARWRFYGEDGHGYGLWRCSHCRNVTGEKYAKAYCPFCGARMDGEDK